MILPRHTVFLPCAALAVFLSCAALGESAPDTPPTLSTPLLAYWTFDGGPAAGVYADESGSADLAAQATGGIAPDRGVFGDAIALQGAHALRVPAFGQPHMRALSLSVWVRPSDLGGYRELFRQENGDDRILFSFQQGGEVLSFGLNVGGYMECDAAIDPDAVLDGAWHHCAATFDGRFLRVFLDGRERGSLERRGRIASAHGQPAFIGSSGGQNEHFQGELDDLRVYGGTLSRPDIRALFTHGNELLADRTARLDAAAAAVYTRRDSFAETFSEVRASITSAAPPMDADLQNALARRLQTDFPEGCASFADYAGVPPVTCLRDPDNRVLVERAAALAELLLEYKPLTEDQWSRQTPEDLDKWRAADTLKARYDALAAQGDAARASSEWLELVLAMGPRVAFRPHVSEPVAPYMRPETPETRTLTPEQARDALVRDWMHQAEGVPLKTRIREEIQWARDLAARIPGDHSRELAELVAVERQAARGEGEEQGLYLAVREAKRTLLFSNPALDFDEILLVDMPYPQGSEWRHETRHRLGYMAVPGGRLLVLKGLHPGGTVRQLMPQPPLHGSFWRPDLSFDAQKVLFCFKPHNEKSFHLYEINVDGSGLRQLTDGPYDDVDPVYLPDGHLLFPTTRGNNYVRCMPPTNSFELARADADGRNLYIISQSNEPDYLPSVMNDGRVVYTRWEYTDKPLWRAQGLWTLHPDGTQVVTFWGNQSVWPDLMKDARAIPGSRRVLFTGSAHHDWFAGSVGIIDPDRGHNFPNGLTKVTADVEWPESGNGPEDPVESPRYHASGKYPAYYSPYPLSETDLLVSAQRDGKFRLYLMDVDGNRELVYEGVHNVLHAMPLKPRPVPPVLADHVAWPTAENRDAPKPGVIYSNNVYQNAPEALRGKAKYLRILQIDPKTYTYWHKRPYISTGPVVSAVQSEGVKRIIGTVPIEEDGSVSFQAPPGQALHFQLLDGDFRALQTMRSFVGVMPGESRGCLGCHESHSRTPQVATKSLATAAAPRSITPPPWKDATVSYARYVRPLLDRYCAECHEGEGEGRKVFDTTERPSPPSFSEPYMTLIGRPAWGAPYAPPEKPEPGFGIAGVMMVEAYDQRDPKAYATPAPMTSLSYRSPLVEMVSSGKHYGVKVDETSRQRLIAWVDALCPYLGDEEVRQIPDPVFQGVDWLSVRPQIENAPVIPRPGPVD